MQLGKLVSSYLCLGFDMGVREPNLGAHIFMVGTLLSKTPLKST